MSANLGHYLVNILHF